MVREDPTLIEEELEARTRQQLKGQFPAADVQVEIRLYCSAISPACAHCHKPSGHPGKHYSYSHHEEW